MLFAAKASGVPIVVLLKSGLAPKVLAKLPVKMMNAETAIIYVVDDDASIREALKNLFRSVGLEVETYSSAQQFLAAKRRDAPGCLVLDIRLHGVSGLDLQHQLLEAQVQIPIIFITGHGDIPMSVRAMKAGAVEFLTKPFRDQDLLDAVHEGIRRDRESRHRRSAIAEISRCYESLTSREKEILVLVVQGLANKVIADELTIAEPTVKLHRSRVMQKMKADSLADLIGMAEKLGIPPGRRRPTSSG